MLLSMTGYGRGEASSGEVTVLVELRSVNNRFRDIQLRCPREYMPLEPRINNVLKDPFTRGRIDAFIRRQAGASSSRVVADSRLAGEYAEVINELAAGMVGFMEREVPLTFILSQPGVMSIAETNTTPATIASAKSAFSERSCMSGTSCSNKKSFDRCNWLISAR